MKECIIGFMLIWGLTPVVLGVVSFLLSFWTRERVTTHYAQTFMRTWYTYLIEKAPITDKDWKKNFSCGIGIFIFYHLIFNMFLGVFLYSEVDAGNGREILMCLLGLAALAAPRYFFDLCNAIKYNFKTRKSESIDKMQDQINELQVKINSKR